MVLNMKYKKVYLKSIDSTNKYTIKNIKQLDDKTIVYADEQTSGKGRNNRTWISSERSNLYFTIVLKPNLKDISVLPNITQYMAVVLCKTFNRYGIIAQIKWPNDVLVNGKKIAGILCETVFKGSDLEGVGVGVGVNLNMTQKFLDTIDQPATALNLLLKTKIDRKRFLDELLQLFFEDYDEFLDVGFLNIRDEYIQMAMFLDKKIRVLVFDEIFIGLAKDIDESGRLILLDENNIEKIVSIGDVIC